MREEECTPAMLVGRTIERIEVNSQNDEMLFVCTDGEAFRAYHMQDCCEDVSIHDISGELRDLVGQTIVEASEETDSEDWPDDVEKHSDYNNGHLDSFTWTTHRFKAANGVVVVVRWLGESNGYYSENVYFQRTHPPIDGFSV